MQFKIGTRPNDNKVTFPSDELSEPFSQFEERLIMRSVIVNALNNSTVIDCQIFSIT